MAHHQNLATALGGPGAVPVTSDAELTELAGEPHPIVVEKVKSALGVFEREWLRHSPFCLIATSGADGTCDVSPKGDPAGFVHVLDDHTIAVPDRPGNRRLDGWRNVLRNGHAGLIFLIPGRGETLRINGRAAVVRDAPFFDQLALDGARPLMALLVRTDEVYLHCSRSLTRAGLWRPDSWAPDAAPARSRPQRSSAATAAAPAATSA